MRPTRMVIVGAGSASFGQNALAPLICSERLRGITLDAWTMDVTNPVAVVNAARLLAAGVDLFTTNTPSALAELLNGNV